MSQSLLDKMLVQWLIENKGAYYNEKGELCVAGEVFTADDYNKMIAESPTKRTPDAGDSASFLELFYPIFNLLNEARRNPPQRR